MSVSVRKLIQRGEARHAPRDRVALEDALHTTLPDDGRLVLVRRLQVRGELVDPARRQEAVRRGWVEAVAGAVHGGGSAADKANCVWFASSEEAEALLARRLLAGEPIEGWFWPLAVPDWRRLSLADWLPRAVAACLAANDAGRLALLAQIFVEADRPVTLVAAIEQAMPASGAPPVDPSAMRAGPGRSDRRGFLEVDRNEILAARIAAKLAPRALPVTWRRMLADLKHASVPRDTADRVVAAIVKERVRRASPALSLKPRLLEMVANAAGRVLVQPHTEPERTGQSRPDERMPASVRSGNDQKPASKDGGSAPSRREDSRVQHVAETRTAAPVRQPAEAELVQSCAPYPLRSSGHAGLWLIVPTLIRLGFGEWLTARADLLGDNPGRSLILAVARHHRIGIDDPALAALAPVEVDEAIPDWAECWRVGLDRWLRRTARRRTHDLAGRSGKFAFGEHRADIHFPLDAADLRLRRLALDRDPGWVGWLGLSIRYHFGAEGVP